MCRKQNPENFKMIYFAGFYNILRKVSQFKRYLELFEVWKKSVNI